MPMSAIELYMAKIEKNRAIWRMMLGEAAKLPHLEEDDRREWAREIDEKVNDGKRRIKVVSPVALKLMGIGIRK